MSVNFFLNAGGGVDGPPTPEGVDVRVWRPREQPSPPLSRQAAVWLQHRLGLFADDRFAELGLWRGDELLHRLIVTPRWYRFQFMADGDLQLGRLWTNPAHRRKGLALAAINEAHRLFGGPGQRFWYVADARNLASAALAHAAGYDLVGSGRRTHPAGIRLLGRFTMDRPAALPPKQPIPTGC